MIRVVLSHRFGRSVFIGVLFCYVLSCHSNLIRRLGRAVFLNFGLSRVQSNFNGSNISGTWKFVRDIGNSSH